MKLNTWNIDLAHSGINFSVRHMVFSKVRGRFATWSGTAHLDDEDLARSALEVEISASSIDTGVADRDNHLRSADFLAAEQFPTLTYKSTAIERIDDTRYRVHGLLTIRDVTREVSLDVEHGGRGKDPWGNERMAFTASASIDRTDFGLKWNQLLEAGGVLVGERIDIDIEVQAVQAAATKAA